MALLPNQIRMTMEFSTGPVTLTYVKVQFHGQELRYGENPDQTAAYYILQEGYCALGNGVQLQPRKEPLYQPRSLQAPSKNNISDADAALGILRHFSDRPTTVIVKHRNPCGVAAAARIEESFTRAWEADMIAAFGGVVAVNRCVSKELATTLASHFIEVLVAPDFTDAALECLAKKKRLMIIQVPDLADLARLVPSLEFSSLIDASLMLQSSQQPKLSSQWRAAVVEHKAQTYQISREATEKEKKDMEFGWIIQSSTRSNSIVYVRDLCTVGIAVGEQDRVGAATLAREKAIRNRKALLSHQGFQSTFADLDATQQREIATMVASDTAGLQGSAMISDGFFPFPDGVEVGLSAGVSAVLQPGGSIRDYLSIMACNKVGASMMFTGQRSFVH